MKGKIGKFLIFGGIGAILIGYGLTRWQQKDLKDAIETIVDAGSED